VSKCHPSHFVCSRANPAPQPRTVSICKSTHNSAKTYRTDPLFPGRVYSRLPPSFPFLPFPLFLCPGLPVFLLFALGEPISSALADASPEMEIAENSTPSTKLRRDVPRETKHAIHNSRSPYFHAADDGDRISFLFPIARCFVIARVFPRKNKRTRLIGRTSDVRASEHKNKFYPSYPAKMKIWRSILV